MGHHSVTCAISRFSISGGTPVRMVIVTSPKHKNNFSTWIVNCAAIKCEYDDYGGIQEIKDSLAKRTMEKMIQDFLVERGVGDNTFHDHPTLKNMTLEQMYDAMAAGTLQVNEAPFKAPDAWFSITRNGEHNSWDRLGPQTPDDPNIPTMRSVMKIIEDAGHKLSLGGATGGHIVEDSSCEFIRIRWDDFSENRVKQLNKLLPLFDNFVAVVVPGRSGDPEIRLTPKLGTKNFHGYHRPLKDNSIFDIRYFFVREDVWQELLAIKSTSLTAYPMNTKDTAVQGIYEGMKNAFWFLHKKLIEGVKAHQAEPAEEQRYSWQLLTPRGVAQKHTKFGSEHYDYIGYFSGERHAEGEVCVNGMSKHGMRVMCETVDLTLAQGSLTEKQTSEVDEFLMDMAEMIQVRRVALMCRLSLSPEGVHQGPQDPEHCAEVTFTGLMYKLALKNKAESDAYSGEDEDEEGEDATPKFVLPLEVVMPVATPVTTPAPVVAPAPEPKKKRKKPAAKSKRPTTNTAKKVSPKKSKRTKR